MDIRVVATNETTIDQSVIKQSLLPIKVLAGLLGMSPERLYLINNGKSKITQLEVDKLHYINSKLDELVIEMRNWIE
jgi:hypothetical protein